MEILAESSILHRKTLGDHEEITRLNGTGKDNFNGIRHHLKASTPASTPTSASTPASTPTSASPSASTRASAP